MKKVTEQQLIKAVETIKLYVQQRDQILEQTLNNKEFQYAIFRAKKLNDLNLSIRLRSCLKSSVGLNITVNDLVLNYMVSDLRKFKNFGRTDLVELQDLFEKNNIQWS